MMAKLMQTKRNSSRENLDLVAKGAERFSRGGTFTSLAACGESVPCGPIVWLAHTLDRCTS